MSGLSPNWITSSVYMWVDIRSYKDSNGDGVGDIQGLISKLDYLREIGIGAMVFPSVQPTDFAYGGTMLTKFCDVAPCFGALKDFDELVQEAHRRNIALVSGWYPYSLHPDHLYFQASRDPSHPQHKTYEDYCVWTSDLNAPIPRGGVVGHWEWDPVRKEYFHVVWKAVDGRWCPETNPYSKKMQEENRRVINFWIDRGMDGFWIDVGSGGDYYKVEDHAVFSREMNATIHALPNKLSIAEDGDSVESTINRDGFDSFWCISRSKALPAYETVFNEDAELGTYVLGLQGHRHSIHEQLLSAPFSIEGGNQRCEAYPSIIAPKNKLMGANDWKSHSQIAKVKQFFALTISLPVIPLFFMGIECGLNLLRTDLPTPRHEYSPMMWDHSDNFGFTTGESFVPTNPDNHPATATVAAQLADSNSVLSCFKRLANLRKDNPALQANEPIPKSYAKIPTQDDKKYFCFLRLSSKPLQKILVVFNFQDMEQEIKCDFGKTKHKINHQQDMLDIYGESEEDILKSNRCSIQVPRHGFKFLEMK